MDLASALAPTVAGLAAEPQLELGVVVAGGGLDRPLTGAHASELLDPTPWLDGGELLMTTGLQLNDAAVTWTFVERLQRIGVACLALGTGPRLSHAAVPATLIEAAERAGLPLLEVPEQTPFLAITQAVYGQLATMRYAEQLRALDAQRALTAAAVEPGGVAALAGTLASLSGMDVLVTDAAGAHLAAAPSEGSVLLTELLGDLQRLRASGLRGAKAAHRPGRTVTVQPLGAQRLRGFLVCASGTPPGPYERQLAAATVSLLTLELERAQRAGSAERQRREAVGRTLLRETLDATAASELLATVGSRAAALRAVVVRPRQTTEPDGGGFDVDAVEGVADALWEGLPDVLLVADDACLTALVLDPSPDLADRVRAAGQTPPATAAGLGARVPIGEAARSARQATRAVRTAQAPGEVVDVLALPSTRLLLELQAPPAIASFTDAVLGAVDRSGPRGPALLASLRAYLESNGAWDDAAAQLGVHRHTLRQRMRTVEQLTSRRLTCAHDRMELLLAFEAKDLVDGGAYDGPDAISGP